METDQDVLILICRARPMQTDFAEMRGKERKNASDREKHAAESPQKRGG